MTATITKPTRAKTTPAKKAKTTRTKTAIKQVAQGLGNLLSWDFKGNNWTPDDLRSLAAASGLDPATIRDVPVTNGMHNGASLWKSQDSHDGSWVRALKVHTDEVNGLYTFGIIKQSIDESAKEGKGIQIDSVCYEPSTKSFISKGKTQFANDLMEAINFRVDHYTGNEFRKWVIMPMLEKWNAIRIMGGLYYVSEAHSKEVNGLEKLCNSCGVNLSVLDQMNTDRTRQGIANKGREGLQERISKLQDNLQKWKDRKGRIRKDGQTALLEEIEDIRKNAAMLESALNAKVGGLVSDLNSIKAEADNVIASQPKGPQTSNKVLQQWRNAMRPEYKLNDSDTYVIPFSDLEQLALPSTAKQKYYYKAGKRLSVALEQIGYTGHVNTKRETIILRPIES